MSHSSRVFWVVSSWHFLSKHTHFNSLFIFPDDREDTYSSIWQIEHEWWLFGRIPTGGSKTNLGNESLINSLKWTYSDLLSLRILLSKNIMFPSLTYLNSKMLFGSKEIQIFPKSYNGAFLSSSINSLALKHSYIDCLLANGIQIFLSELHCLIS